VPGCNDSLENLRGIASLSSELGVRTVELMPYHELGRDKYENLGRTCSLETPGAETLELSLRSAVETFLAAGLSCRLSE
jgi:pyruvate formate lyase activating enzyme